MTGRGLPSLLAMTVVAKCLSGGFVVDFEDFAYLGVGHAQKA